MRKIGAVDIISLILILGGLALGCYSSYYKGKEDGIALIEKEQREICHKIELLTKDKEILIQRMIALNYFLKSFQMDLQTIRDIPDEEWEEIIK